ncbi:MAG: hypothetical protein RLZZ622_63 [Planctomycetota bacterium]
MLTGCREIVIFKADLAEILRSGGRTATTSFRLYRLGRSPLEGQQQLSRDTVGPSPGKRRRRAPAAAVGEALPV